MDIKTLELIPPWDWPEDTAELLIETLRDSQAPLAHRLAAAEMAGETVVMDDDLAEVLLDIVRSNDEREQLRAVAAISFGPGLEQTEMDGFDEDDPLADPTFSQEVYEKIQETFRRLYIDERVPKLVRRRILEASVRAQQGWHKEAVAAAASTDGDDWKLTAIFCMRYVRGFDEEVMEALESPNSDIHYEAIHAAGHHELEAAWPHIAALLSSDYVDKNLLLAAIEAAPSINPEEAVELLSNLVGSDDEDVSEAANEALLFASHDDDDEMDDEDDEDEDDEDEDDEEE